MRKANSAIYRATLLARVRRKVAEAGGKSLETSEVEAIVREEWRKVAKGIGC